MTLRPPETLPVDRWIEYDIALRTDRGDVWLSEELPNLTYPGEARMRFVIKARIDESHNRLGALTAKAMSCRATNNRLDHRIGWHRGARLDIRLATSDYPGGIFAHWNMRPFQAALSPIAWTPRE